MSLILPGKQGCNSIFKFSPSLGSDSVHVCSFGWGTAYPWLYKWDEKVLSLKPALVLTDIRASF